MQPSSGGRPRILRVATLGETAQSRLIGRAMFPRLDATGWAGTAPRLRGNRRATRPWSILSVRQLAGWLWEENQSSRLRLIVYFVSQSLSPCQDLQLLGRGSTPIE